MLVFKELTWDNVFSYGQGNKLSLDNHNLVQLVGLNGHGKSSIPLILEEVLFSKNSKNIKKSDLLNRYVSSKTLNIGLKFTINNDEYELTLSRGSTQKVKLIKNGLDISGHTSTNTLSYVEKLLGFDFKIFTQIVYQNGNTSLQFLTATDTTRKKFLIELLNLEKYTAAFEVIKELQTKELEKLNKLKSIKEFLTSWINKLDVNTLVKKELLPIPEEVNLDDINKLNSLKSDLLNIEKINKNIEQNNQYKKFLKNIPADLLSINIEQSTIDIKSYQDKVAIYSSKITELQKLVSQLNKLNQVCPTCSRELSDNEKHKLITEYQDSIKTKTRLLTELKTIINDFNEKEEVRKEVIRKTEEFEKYMNLIDPELQEELLDKKSLLFSIDKLSSKIDNVKKELNRVKIENEKIIAHNSKVDTLIEQKLEKEKQLEECKLDLEVQQEVIDKIEVLKKSFSTNGLIAYKLENSIKDLENITNEYLTELSDGRFQLYFKVENDKLNIVISDNNKEIDILALSAGELSRVSTATLLAIRKLLSSVSKNKINILFLDETIDILDIEGKEKLIEILLKEDQLNTFIVSHGYTHPLLHKINVVKSNNISKLEE